MIAMRISIVWRMTGYGRETVKEESLIYNILFFVFMSFLSCGWDTNIIVLCRIY